MEVTRIVMLIQIPVVACLCVLSFQARKIFQSKPFKYIFIAWVINLIYVIVKFITPKLDLTPLGKQVAHTSTDLVCIYVFMLGAMAYKKPQWLGGSKWTQRIIVALIFFAAGLLNIFGDSDQDGTSTILLTHVPVAIIDVITLLLIARSYKSFVNTYPIAKPLYFGGIMYAAIQVLTIFRDISVVEITGFGPLYLQTIGFTLGLMSKFIILLGMMLLLLNAVRLITQVNNELIISEAYASKLNQIIGRTFHEISPPLLEIETITNSLTPQDGDSDNIINKRVRRKIELIESAINRLRTILTASSKMYRSEIIPINPGAQFFELPMPIEEEINIQNVNTLIEIAIMNFKAYRFEELTKNHFVTDRIKFTAEYGANCNIHCNSVEMVQVFFNLIKNSYEACLLEGRICQVFIKTKNIRETVDSKENDTAANSFIKKICIEFEDNGPGIPDENFQKIFEQGFSTKSKKGRGFGLEVAKKYTESNKGTIQVESPVLQNRLDNKTPMPGVKFILMFPKENS